MSLPSRTSYIITHNRIQGYLCTETAPCFDINITMMCWEKAGEKAIMIIEVDSLGVAKRRFGLRNPKNSSPQCQFPWVRNMFQILSRIERAKDSVILLQGNVAELMIAQNIN